MDSAQQSPSCLLRQDQGPTGEQPPKPQPRLSNATPHRVQLVYFKLGCSDFSRNVNGGLQLRGNH